jgi:hypothetical protein
MTRLLSYQTDSIAPICVMSARKQVSRTLNIHSSTQSLDHFVNYQTGMFAIREERDYCVNDDFMKAVRKVAESKKLETKLDTTLTS